MHTYTVATSLWQPDSEQNSVASGNLSLLGSFGEPFMETVCRDACSGHDVARVRDMVPVWMITSRSIGILVTVVGNFGL